MTDARIRRTSPATARITRVYLVGRLGDRDAVDRIASLAKRMFAGEAYAVSGEVFERSDGKWVVVSR